MAKGRFYDTICWLGMVFSNEQPSERRGLCRFWMRGGETREMRGDEGDIEGKKGRSKEKRKNGVKAVNRVKVGKPRLVGSFVE